MTSLVETCNKWLSCLPIGESARIFHGRGRCFTGYEQINVEAIGNILSVIFYKPVANEQQIIEEMWTVFNQHHIFEKFVVQRRYLSGAPWQWLLGDCPNQEVVVEDGLKYHFNFSQQNQGLFLDIRAGRRWVRQHAKDCKVLNLFAYTCGFSVAATAGGATETVNFDISKASLQKGRMNLSINAESETQHRFLGHDILKSLGKLKRLGPFDLVVMDPPSRQPDSFLPERDYPKILKRSREWLTPDARVLLVDNDPDKGVTAMQKMISDAAPWLTFLERVEMDSVICEQNPEFGLKVLAYQFLTKN